MQQEQEEEQPRRELRKGDKLGRQGGSGIMTRKRRLPRCDFFASFRHPPLGLKFVSFSLSWFGVARTTTMYVMTPQNQRFANKLFWSNVELHEISNSFGRAPQPNQGLVSAYRYMFSSRSQADCLRGLPFWLPSWIWKRFLFGNG